MNQLQLIDYLEQLDLSEIEAKLYLTLLKSGPISVRELAKLIGVKRTTTYMYIEQLVDKGLIAKLVKGSRKQILANPPEESVKFLIEERLKSAKMTQDKFPEILKNLNSQLPQIKSPENYEIKYTKGINSIRKLYEEAFRGKEMRSYVKLEEISILSSDNAILFNKAFQKNKNLKMWEIIYDSTISRKQVAKNLAQKNNYFYKFMPKELKWSLTSEDILIFDGRVAIINYYDNASCIVLQSPDFYNNSKELFDFIWRVIPESKNP